MAQVFYIRRLGKGLQDSANGFFRIQIDPLCLPTEETLTTAFTGLYSDDRVQGGGSEVLTSPAFGIVESLKRGDRISLRLGHRAKRTMSDNGQPATQVLEQGLQELTFSIRHLSI